MNPLTKKIATALLAATALTAAAQAQDWNIALLGRVPAFQGQAPRTADAMLQLFNQTFPGGAPNFTNVAIPRANLQWLPGQFQDNGGILHTPVGGATIQGTAVHLYKTSMNEYSVAIDGKDPAWLFNLAQAQANASAAGLTGGGLVLAQAFESAIQVQSAEVRADAGAAFAAALTQLGWDRFAADDARLQAAAQAIRGMKGTTWAFRNSAKVSVLVERALGKARPHLAGFEPQASVQIDSDEAIAAAPSQSVGFLGMDS